nr:MAG TPA: hypothetical protein [Caudoviricetes sp.]
MSFKLPRKFKVLPVLSFNLKKLYIEFPARAHVIHERDAWCQGFCV